MTINLPEINGPAYTAARQNTSSHGVDQRGPDRRRPQHVRAGDKLLVPAFDDGLRPARAAASAADKQRKRPRSERAIRNQSQLGY
jgi:hypothetical protein